MGEFDLIERYFKRADRAAQRESLVALGIGDDCALLTPRPGTQIAISSDMLVEGRHFLSTVNPASLGHKALAVNLSDLAACGAQPIAFTLALSLPSVDEAWLAGFSSGLFALADANGCELIGGDTTRGPLNICITIFGEVPVASTAHAPSASGRTTALLRRGAQAGDDLYVSGTLGGARLALEVFRGTVAVPEDVFARARLRMEQPTPRVELGMALRGIATSAIDISDGLLGDLGHILKASHLGATIATEDATQLVANYSYSTGTSGTISSEFVQKRLGWVLAGGDDYELAFTAPPALRDAVAAAAAQANTPVTRIGQIDAQAGLRLVDASGQAVANTWVSFDHFA